MSQSIFQKKLSVLSVINIVVIAVFVTIVLYGAINRMTSMPMIINSHLSTEKKTQLLQIFAGDAVKYLNEHPKGRVVISNA